MSDNPDDIEDELEVEIVADTPAPAQDDVAPDKGASDEDLAGYSDKVKKRISKLTFEREEERRQRIAAEKLAEEAVTYGKQMREEAERSRKTIETGEGVVVGQAKLRVDAQLATVTTEYKQAYESGDPELMAKATAQLAQLGAEKARLESIPQRRPGPELAPPPAAPQKAPGTEKAQAWVARNPWFHADPGMQGFAVGVNNQLVAEGVDPNSDVFYSRIDAAVKQRFPEKFDAGDTEEPAPRRTASVVAPTSRNTGSVPRTVTLTQTEVALANRLGVPLKDYAAQKLKLRQNNG